MIPYTNFLEYTEMDEQGFENIDFGSYPETVSDFGEWGSPQRLVNVECWPGSATDRADANTVISLDGSVDVQQAVENKVPIAVYDELDTDDQYSCSWSYETDGTVYTDLSNVGEVVEMQKKQPDEALKNVVKEHDKKIDGLDKSYNSLSKFEEKTSSYVTAEMN